MLSSLWRSRSEQSQARRKPASVRLTLEALEDRTVPALFTAASVSDLITDINAANLTAESDTITLTPGTTFSLTAVTNYTNGPTGLPTVLAGEDLTIVGNGDVIARSAVTGTPGFRLFDVVAGAALTLRDMTLQGGLAFGPGVAACGGAVLNQGALTLDGVTVQNNAAVGYSPSIYEYAPGGAAAGGGVYSGGTLMMTGCTIQHNWAVGGSGDPGVIPYYFGSADGPPYTPPPTDGQDGGDAFGGGVYIAGGELTITSSIITGNKAQGGAGGNGYSGYYGTSRSGDGGNGFGGGLYLAGGSGALHSVTVTLNVALSGAGGTAATKKLDGKPGQGEGGGTYIDAAALVSLDAFTRDHVLNNTASTGKSNILGSYKLIR
jgi:hypothetical protein